MVGAVHRFGVLLQARHRAEHDVVRALPVVRNDEPHGLPELHADLGGEEAHVVGHHDADHAARLLALGGPAERHVHAFRQRQ